LLFHDFYKQFGGKIRLLATGMAPIRRNLGKFFERLQLPLCESYGMVEAGSLTYRPPGSRDYSSVGKALRGVTLVFTPEKEIIVSRETPMTLRYFQCADGENERTFIAPGRIATGDMGRLDGKGNLFLLGRKKELLVTPSGLKLHPEVVEQELNNSPDIAHSVIYMKPHATQLTCVVDLSPPGDEAAIVKHDAGWLGGPAQNGECEAHPSRRKGTRRADRQSQGRSRSRRLLGHLVPAVRAELSTYGGAGKEVPRQRAGDDRSEL